jgi:triosephosphate isomerase
MKPIIIVNFKTNAEATAENALKLARAMDQAKRKTGAEIIAAAQNADIYRLASSGLSIQIFAQHADAVSYGSHTGSQLPEALKAAGAAGAVINHAERKLSNEEAAKAAARCREVGLKSLVCVENLEKARVLLNAEPDYLAFEIPELIGTLKSVSQLAPDSVRVFSEIVSKHNRSSKRRTIPLCGAGVANGPDVKKALELGTEGVLVATAVVKAKDPGQVLEEMANVQD